jgi:hypothetical protein
MVADWAFTRRHEVQATTLTKFNAASTAVRTLPIDRRVTSMATYDFTLILSGPTELTDELADKLFAAGCDDATPSSAGGVISIDFGRDSSDLETAIRSAIANVSTAGYVVARVEIDAEAAGLKN